MSKIFPTIDPEGLIEYSVVFNDRSLNHMSQYFQTVMRDISSTMKSVYKADEFTLVPGGGTVGMEAIARQFARDRRCLVLRNGWFSYRWSQIFDTCRITSEHRALLARSEKDTSQSPFSPMPLEEIIEEIRTYKPELFFAAHVETAAGMLLPDNYLETIASEVHKQGGLFVLDCIASGSLWIDMKKMGVDILLSAPQKSWSSSPSCALIMLSDRAAQILKETQSDSFALDLAKWRAIVKAYEDGGHAYHATLPTDALARFRDTSREMAQVGWDTLRERQWQLGKGIRSVLAEFGYKSVAKEGFEAPTVVVSYATDEAIHKGIAFARLGLQTAAGVPLACKERSDFQSFRIGLFGLDKLTNIDRTISTLKETLARI